MDMASAAQQELHHRGRLFFHGEHQQHNKLSLGVPENQVAAGLMLCNSSVPSLEFTAVRVKVARSASMTNRLFPVAFFA